MATRKITVTLDVEQVEAVRRLVESGQAASVSGFVQHAVTVALDDVAGWGAMLAQALDETGGPMSADERRWADEVLDRAQGAGRLLAAAGTSDIVDARVVLCARRARQRVVTSDPDDLAHLDPGLGLIVL